MASSMAGGAPSGRGSVQRSQAIATQARGATGTDTEVAASSAPKDEETVLPLPNWLRKLYFIFPIVLYVPDAIFNFYVYSDGVNPPNASPVMQVAFFALWGFVATGVVGMAYLLSVLAPWHWGQRHRVQAFFCGLGVLIATAITTWNSLAYRSISFHQFNTDKWIYSLWPQLQQANFSITMVLVAVAPPFWGLFWAIVQPTQNSRHNLAQLQESHAERLVRIQQEAEVKRIRAETNAKIREAQLRGMAQTAAAARAQAAGLIAQGRKGDTNEVPAVTAANGEAPQLEAPRASERKALPSATPESGDSAMNGDSGEHAANISRFQPHTLGRDNGSHGMSMHNSVAPSTPAVRVYSEPTSRPQAPTFAAQPAMFGDVQGSMGVPASDVRRPPVFGSAFDDDSDEMTGTSGPRHAIRRPNEVSALTSSLSELHPAYAQAVQEALRELSADGPKGKIPASKLAAAVAQKLNVDDPTARKIIARYREQVQQPRGSTPRR